MGIAEIVAIAGSIILAEAAAIGVLWRSLLKEREHSSSLQAELNKDHKRDLRRFAGLPTSLDPPAPAPVVRDTAPKPPRPRNPPRK